MEPDEQRRWWIEPGIFTAAAFLLYQVRALFFLAAVPLFLLGFRRGRHAQLYGIGLFILAVFVQTVVRMRGLDEPQLARFFTVIEMAYPVSLAVGIFVIQWRGERTLYKLLESTALVGLLSMPIILVYSQNAVISAFMGEQIRLITEAINNAFERGTLTASAGNSDAEGLVELIKGLFFRNFLFSYFLMLSGVWALSDGIYRRMIGDYPFRLKGFSVPVIFLWPFLGLWAGILLDTLAGLGFIGYIVWNGGMVLLFVYALQGIGILQTLFTKYGVGAGLRIAVTIASIIILFTPGINLVLVAGVPLLGVSEYWIHYRIGEGE
ncbi:MAG: hypothetical protein ACLFQW_04760 [Spirochaetaceae bacterium]